ncbi:MAG: hypothetical protein RLZ56_614 [Bacteroidota bacterium]|jgi:1-acyl-sn-glycerol-3-phosphate acyltransferase
MRLIKKIIARILAFWALLMFVGTMFIYMWFYIPCAFLPDPYKTRWHRLMSQLWMGSFMLLSGIRFSIQGKENFDGLENAVIVCNHNSLLDIPISFPFLPRANKTIAKKSFSYVPIFGWIYTFGTVLVDRKDPRSRQASFEQMKMVLNHGLDMLIYPEGTRNTTSAPLKSFFDGAFKLAVETQKPIVPIVLLNTKNMLPSKPSMYFKPGKISMHILPAIMPQGHTIDSLKQLVYDIMAEHYLANEPKKTINK